MSGSVDELSQGSQLENITSSPFKVRLVITTDLGTAAEFCQINETSFKSVPSFKLLSFKMVTYSLIRDFLVKSVKCRDGPVASIVMWLRSVTSITKRMQDYFT